LTMPNSEGPLVRSILETIQKARLYRSCITCTRFDEPNEQCQLYQQRPPARVIAMGCEAYDEEPPF
jgi:hypothetical protein